MTSREKYAQQRRFRTVAHILISVVALIECFVLMSFTTYSWIESSSSLIISSGKDGLVNMAVAKNINYEILVSTDAAGNVNLTREGNEVDDGFYRSVEHFSYAKATTPDGSHFFFKRPASLGLSGAAAYRSADTADYNISYTYIDFILRNTTGVTKGFYFNPGAHTSMFSIENRSDLNNIDTTVFTGYTAEQVILGAMRLSFSKDGDTPSVYSLDAHSSTSPVDAAGAANSTVLTTTRIADKEYDDSDLSREPVFESQYTDIENTIEMRVWFDENDSVYSNLTTENKTIVDNVMYAATIALNFQLINDTVPYDQVYFDDYAFSDTAVGKHVTRENAAYGMYLHVYNNKLDDFINYPMSISSSSTDAAVRWVTSVPLPYVVEGLLTTTTPASVTDKNSVVHSNVFNESYFYYGTSDGTATPTAIAYKWPLPGAFTVTDRDSDGTNDKITNNVVRNLGVVRTSGNYSTAVVYDSTEPVNGFLQFDSDDAMTMVYFRDRATALTGGTYNQDDSGNVASGFITDSRTSVPLSGGSVNYSKIYYCDIPSTSVGINFSIGSGGGTDQTTNITTFRDGNCFHLTSSTSGGHRVAAVTTAVTLPTAASEGLSGVKRIYFYDDHATIHWEDPKIYNWNDSLASYPGVTMQSVTAPSDTRQVDRVYVNRKSASDNGTAATQAATAKTTVQLVYDTTAQLWKGYVPASWLTSAGTYFHYNGKNTYYDDSTENIRWNAGAASQYNGTDYIYTALGYTNAQKLGSLTGGAGVGTWTDVREISFATELIDTKVSPSYVYKVGTGAGQYAMAPADSLLLTFKAYVPATDALASQSTNHSLRFTRYAAYNSGTVTGYWYPQENITDDELIYYATDAAASSDANTADHGWFHVAVFVDGTFENLVYDTTRGTEGASSGGYLAYSFDGSAYTNIAVNGGADLYSLDTTRWAIPMHGYNYIWFKWAPYPSTSTVFIFTHDTTYGIYYVVTEASAS